MREYQENPEICDNCIYSEVCNEKDGKNRINTPFRERTLKQPIFGIVGKPVRLDCITKYSEICDGCGKRRVCQLFTSLDYNTFIDLCKTCQKEFLE